MTGSPFGGSSGAARRAADRAETAKTGSEAAQALSEAARDLSETYAGIVARAVSAAGLTDPDTLDVGDLGYVSGSGDPDEDGLYEVQAGTPNTWDRIGDAGLSRKANQTALSIGLNAAGLADTSGAVYETLTPGAGNDAASLVSFVNSSGSGFARGSAFSVTSGESFLVFYHLDLTSGQAPKLALRQSNGAAASDEVTAITGFVQAAVLTATLTGNYAFGIANTSNSEGVLRFYIFRRDDVAGSSSDSNAVQSLLALMAQRLADDQFGENTGTFGDTTSGDVYETLTQPYLGRIVAVNSSGAARARVANQRSYSEGEKSTLFYRLNLNSGEPPRAQLANAAGSARSNYPRLVAGGWQRVVLTATSSGTHALCLHSPEASDFELDWMFFAGEAPIFVAGQREQQQIVGALERVTADNRESGAAWLAKRSTDIRFAQPSGSLTGYSATSGATVSGETVTLAGADAYAALAVSASDEVVWLDTIVAIASGNTLDVAIRAGGSDVLNFQFDPADDEIDEIVDTANYAPGNNLDMTAEFRIRVSLDTLKKVAQVCVLYENSAGATNPDQQQHYFIEDVSWTGSTRVDEIRLRTGSAGSGDVTLRRTALTLPSYVTLGSSIIAGTGISAASFNPVPGWATGDDVTAAGDYWLSDYLGGTRRALNFGVASGGSANVVNRIDEVLKYRPGVVLTDMGLSNDVNDGVTTSTTRANVQTVIDACQAAGVYLVIMECLPRNVFTDDESALAIRHNAWLRQMALEYGFGVAICHDALRDLSSLSNIATIYAPDNTHPDKFGHQKLAPLWAAGIAKAQAR